MTDGAGADCSEDLNYQIGDRIGGEYLIKDILGGPKQSGMGVVYLVEHRSLPFPFVLKTYQAAHKETDFSEQFREEAEAWISVGGHPNIVKALRVDCLDFRLFVAAEYIARDAEGRCSIRDFIRCSVSHPFVVLAWATQFCCGMNYARSKGVRAHRDIKPENLLVDPKRNLKITDFGLAHLHDTKDLVPAGTLPYMAPEQILAPQEVDHRSDIYAFGIVAYELCTGGQYPYEIPGKSRDFQADFVRAHTKLSPRKIDTPLFSIIERCLNKDPARRYQNYSDLLVDIEDVAARLRYRLPKQPRANADDDSEALYVKAQALSALGKSEEALRIIEEYVLLYPGDSCGWTEKGRILSVMNRLEEAERSFLKSLQLFGFSSAAWNNLGILYGRKERWRDAITSYQRALEYDPGNSGALMNMGLLHFKAKEYSKCAEVFARAVQKFPEKETLLFNAGNSAALMMKNGFLSEAIQILKGLVSAKPKVLNYWHNLAIAFWHSKDAAGASACFKKVLEIDPSEDFALASLRKLEGLSSTEAEA